MSTSGRKAKESAQIVLDVIHQTNVSAIFQGWDRELLASLSVSSSVYSAGSLPHNWLFAQVSAVIHHGGLGTTAAGLRSGAPSIVIPHIIDQYAWGQTVFDLGVGPKFISRGKLTSKNLAHSIALALSDSDIRAKAAQWESAAFSSIFFASSFFCSQGESSPAHMRLTLAVRCLKKWINVPAYQ